MDPLVLVVVIVAAALVFDFLNGFNDAANSIATIVATRVLTPTMAVAWAAFFNFVSAFGFGTAVAKTIGSGMVHADVVTQYVVLTGLLGAISWTWLTSYLGLPISASHALIGGYAGAAMARVGLEQGWSQVLSAIVPRGWLLTILFIFCAPLMGMAAGSLLMISVSWLFRNRSPQKLDRYFRILQLFSSGVFSFAHGTNDAQKTMGIITAALFVGGYLESFEVPFWVILSAHAAIALGTFLGGWKVVRTMGHRLTKLKPVGGFCAETGGAATVLFAAGLGIPASTTHTIAGAIAGVGVVRRVRAVRWGKATEIVWAWVLTLPTTIVGGGLCYLLARALGFDN
ncbi:MAG: inorganic phosphate transporter [Bryobacterales bacterium]